MNPSKQILAFNVRAIMRKRGLSSRGLPGISQTNMRRILSAKGCTLSTLDAVGAALKLEPSALLSQRGRLARLLDRLTEAQKAEALRGMARTAWSNRAVIRKFFEEVAP